MTRRAVPRRRVVSLVAAAIFVVADTVWGGSSACDARPAVTR
jgi:hypothetical protein